jgi:hypothetical protein
MQAIVDVKMGMMGIFRISRWGYFKLEYVYHAPVKKRKKIVDPFLAHECSNLIGQSKCEM